MALANEETKAMADWCLYLGSSFPEAVQRVVQMELKGVYAFGIIEKLLKSPVLQNFPKECCHYASAVMRGEDFPYLDEQHMDLHKKFKQTASETAEFKEFEELLYLRGWKK